MAKKQFSHHSFPLAFFLAALLSYGLLIPWTGFYWDDWPFVWIARFLGPANFLPAFRGFRPFLGPIFFVTTSLIPPDPILWQGFALLIRFLAGLAFWSVLDQLWPDRKIQTLAAALLMIVFPGYSQNWVAVTHINQEWIPLIFYLLSFGFTLRAMRTARTGRRFDTNVILALLFMLLGLFPTEYFFGLEPLRFLFIWVVLSRTVQVQGFRSRLLQTLKTWWPYALIWLVDAVWLAYYYRSGAYISYGVVAAQSLPSIRDAIVAILDTFWKVGFYTWIQILVLAFHTISAPTTLISLALIVGSFILLIFYFLRLDSADTSSGSTSTADQGGSLRKFITGNTCALQAIPIGLAGILLGRIPSLAAALPLTLQSSFDRLMISMMIGGSLFVVGLVDLLACNLRLKITVLALLTAFGIGQQFFNANIFRRDWQGQQQIYWELAWRIPALTPGTALLTQQMPLDYETDLSMTAPLNWIYARQIDPPALPYALIYTEKRAGGVVLPGYQPGTPLQLPYRTLTFKGSISNVVVIYVPANGCLRVLDPAFNDAVTYDKFPTSLTAPIALSDPSLILANTPASPLPSPPFTSEPSHTWCYYYEKAELARQSRDWATVADLGRQAQRQGFAPRDPFEWLPFIEAYARSGDLNTAQQLTLKSWDQTQAIHRGLCQLWARVQSDGPDSARSAAENELKSLGCTP